jgi:hypothetical protein
VPAVVNHAVDQRFPTVMAITISRFCEFTLEKVVSPVHVVLPNDYVQRRAVLRRGESPSKPTNKKIAPTSS